MPAHALVAIGPQDELLRLTGSAGNPYQDITATGAGTGKYYGVNRTVQLIPVVAGTVSGTNPTLDVKLQDSADGVTYADMGISFPQITASNAAATLSLSEITGRRAVYTQTGRPWVREFHTIGGTATPTFNSFALLHETALPF